MQNLISESLQNNGEFDLNITKITLVHKNRFPAGFSFGDYRFGRSGDGIVFCDSGVGAFVYKDETILLREGECTFLPQGSRYTVRTEGSEPFVHYTVNFTVSELCGESSSLFSSVISGKTRYITSSAHADGLRSLFEALLSEWQAKREGYLISSKGILYTVLYRYLTAVRRAARQESAYSLLRPAKNLLDGSLSSPPSSAELAELCSVSEAHFRRLWKKQFGTTPTEYARKKRLLRARDMLLSGVYTVKDAAKEVGFEDANYFSRVFRKEFGLSPTEFMK